MIHLNIVGNILTINGSRVARHESGVLYFENPVAFWLLKRDQWAEVLKNLNNKEGAGK